MTEPDTDDRGIVVVDDNGPSPTCVIAFAALYHPTGLQPAELLEVSAGLPAMRIVARDLEQAWYQRGIRDLGDDVASTVTALRALLDARGITRTVCFGNSAGGYAALQYGSLLEAHAVHAFATQTNMNHSFYEEHNLHAGLAIYPKHLREPVHTLWASVDGKRVLDLRPVVEQTSVPVHLYYSTGNYVDTCHAEHLAGLPNVTLHGREGNAHALARIMRDSGELRQILSASIA